MEVIDVFAHNFHSVTRTIDSKLRDSFDVITLDTEFPGCLHRTPQYASIEQRYTDLRYNILNTKLVQVGITLSDKLNNVAGTWQFNLSDFNPEVDLGSPDSVSLLVSSGIDFTKNMSHGIAGHMFAKWFVQTLVLHREKHLTWVTFHGLYDFGYLLSLLISPNPLPGSVFEFVELMFKWFWFGHKVYDLKVVAEWYMKKGLGLERLAEAVGATRAAGVAHQAGSDSLLTADVFGRMRGIGVEVKCFKGCLYGICGDDGARRRVDVGGATTGLKQPARLFYQVVPSTVGVWSGNDLSCFWVR